MKYLVSLALLLATTLPAATPKLLDKVAGVINETVYTLSEIRRIKSTLAARNEISPLIYKKTTYSDREVLKLLQQRYIVRDKLAELGFVVSDDSVESRVKETEKRLGLSRQDLLNFLETKGLEYNEYFELIREAMEFNIFNSRIIAPLVNITEQEVKNAYYKRKSSNTALSFNYQIVDFYISTTSILDSERIKMPQILEEYQKTGNLPESFRNLETSDLGKVRGDDLPKDLNKLLKNTDEGAFTQTYERDGNTHVFFIKSKDLTESQDFSKQKDRIYQELFMKRSSGIIANWFSRESLNYYILENI